MKKGLGSDSQAMGLGVQQQSFEDMKMKTALFYLVSKSGRIMASSRNFAVAYKTATRRHLVLRFPS